MLANTTKKLIPALAFSIGLAACGDSTQQSELSSESHKGNHFPNVVEVKQFGDTLRLEIEKRGDTLIKHYIDLKSTDLKGMYADEFDGSYNAACTYQEVKNDASVNSNFYVTEGDYQLYFSQKKVAAYCDSVIKGLTSTGYKGLIEKPYYENLKRRALNKTDTFYSNQTVELLQNFDCKIVNQKTKDKPKLVLIELYRTEFSGGKNLYIITGNGDTVKLFHQQDYIN